jgi:hypothetical protein
MPKDTFYFSHDYNARNDEKIKRLIRKHGMIGYGIFWSIVEDLYNNANALRTDYDGIAYDLRSDSEIVASVVNDFDLFIFSGDFFGSNSVQERLDQRNNKSESARKSASYRWDNANALQTQSEGNAKKERKGKEIKGKEIKIKYKDNILLTEKENEKLVLEYGEDVVRKCYEFLSSYKVEKSYSTKSDYLTIRRWVLDAVNKPNKTVSSQNSINPYQQQLEAAREAYKSISAK